MADSPRLGLPDAFDVVNDDPQTESDSLSQSVTLSDIAFELGATMMAREEMGLDQTMFHDLDETYQMLDTLESFDDGLDSGTQGMASLRGGFGDLLATEQQQQSVQQYSDSDWFTRTFTSQSRNRQRRTNMPVSAAFIAPLNVLVLLDAALEDIDTPNLGRIERLITPLGGRSERPSRPAAITQSQAEYESQRLGLIHQRTRRDLRSADRATRSPSWVTDQFRAWVYESKLLAHKRTPEHEDSGLSQSQPPLRKKPLEYEKKCTLYLHLLIEEERAEDKSRFRAATSLLNRGFEIAESGLRLLEAGRRTSVDASHMREQIKNYETLQVRERRLLDPSLNAEVRLIGKSETQEKLGQSVFKLGWSTIFMSYEIELSRLEDLQEQLLQLTSYCFDPQRADTKSQLEQCRARSKACSMAEKIKAEFDHLSKIWEKHRDLLFRRKYSMFCWKNEEEKMLKTLEKFAVKKERAGVRADRQEKMMTKKLKEAANTRASQFSLGLEDDMIAVDECESRGTKHSHAGVSDGITALSETPSESGREETLPRDSSPSTTPPDPSQVPLPSTTFSIEIETTKEFELLQKSSVFLETLLEKVSDFQRQINAFYDTIDVADDRPNPFDKYVMEIKQSTKIFNTRVYKSGARQELQRGLVGPQHNGRGFLHS